MRPLRRWEVYATGEGGQPLLHPPGLPHPRFWTRGGADREARDLNHYAALLRYRHSYAVRPTRKENRTDG